MPEVFEQFPIIRTIDAELEGSGFKAQIVTLSLSEPVASVLRSETAYIIDMCLTPRPAAAKGNYREHWGPHRFEKLGDIYFVPPGESLNVRGDVVRQAALMCELSAAAVHEQIGTPLSWSQQKLAATLDIGSARIRALAFAAYRRGSPSRHRVTPDDRSVVGRACHRDRSLLPRPVGKAADRWPFWLAPAANRRTAEAKVSILRRSSELAAICGLSVRQLTRGFRVSRGCSIGDYLEQRRMEHSKRLLMQGEAVKGVAFALGLSLPVFLHFRVPQGGGHEPDAVPAKAGAGH